MCLEQSETGTVVDEAREMRGVEDLSVSPGVTGESMELTDSFTAKLPGLLQIMQLSGLASDSGWDWTIQDSFIHKSSILTGRLGLSHSLCMISLGFLT